MRETIQRYTMGGFPHGSGKWVLYSDHAERIDKAEARNHELAQLLNLNESGVSAVMAAIEGKRAAEARNKVLASALEEAAMSLETIAEQSGRDEFMKYWDQVRGYAQSRANVAHAALREDR